MSRPAEPGSIWLIPTSARIRQAPGRDGFRLHRAKGQSREHDQVRRIMLVGRIIDDPLWSNIVSG
jgi:hypothetical protein